jgi:hypothetical protein
MLYKKLRINSTVHLQQNLIRNKNNVEHYKETGKIHAVEQVPTLLVNDKKLKDPKNVVNGFNNFFTKNTKKLNIQRLEKGNAISYLKD